MTPPGPTTPEPFAPKALYELKIDTDGVAVANIAFQVRFASSPGRGQTATLRRLEGAQAAATGEGGQVIVEAASVSTAREAQVTHAGGYRFFAGWRSDPFFFDTRGANNNFQFTGEDFFAERDVCSIVLEAPNSALGRHEVGLWARTLINTGGSWVQADRGARPSQTPFLTGEQNAAYRTAEPVNDAQFISVFAHALEHTVGYTPEEAMRVAGTMLPDLMRYNSARPASFPSSGRMLTDDVSDAFISVVTNGKVSGDKVGPHRDLLPEFPFLGPPHESR